MEQSMPIEVPARPQLTPKLIRNAWKYGDLSPFMRESQRVLRSAWEQHQLNGLKSYWETSRRLGKSTLGLMLCLEEVTKRKGTALYCAPVGTGLDDFITKLIPKILATCPEDLRPVYSVSNASLTTYNGGVVEFRPCNNKSYQSRRGSEWLLAFIDEGRDIDDLEPLIESVVLPGLLSTDGKLIISSTPADNPDHPLWIYRERAKAEGWFSQVTIWDAAKLDPMDFPLERIERFRKETTDPFAWKCEYECEWVKDPNKSIIPEWESKFVKRVPHDQYFEFYHKYSGLDTGVNDATSNLFGYYDFLNATLVIEDEVWLTDADVNVQNIVATAKQKEATLGYTDEEKGLEMYRRVGDCAAKVELQSITAAGLPVYPCIKTSLLGMVSTLRDWIKQGRILVHPRCRMLIGCLEAGMWNKDHTEFGHSKVYRHFDPIAALMYLIRHVDTNTNPIPKTYGMTPQTHWISSDVEPSKNARVLATLFRHAAPIRSTTDDWRER